PMHQRQRGVGYRRQTVEDLAASGDEVLHQVDLIQGAKLIEVGPAEETGRLAGEQDQARWGPVIEVVEHLRQLGQYFAGKPVHGRLGAVDFQPGDSCRVSAEPEMPESHCVSIVHGSRTSGFTVSTNITPPCPPPMQM